MGCSYNCIPNYGVKTKIILNCGPTCH
uniref:Uncharacterized protein n=1 Tax=Arundo donax TaxID=35708 RepID=A0A0A9HPQ1_ARUDO